jgi:uncharacterized protein YbjT (DUF2867 family)
MASKPIIAVVGATGAQGGGLIRAILDDPRQRFAARAVVRRTDTDAARQLAERGVELVAADLGDEVALTQAFAGAHGAYCVTFFWAHMSPETEIEHARNLASAARRAGIAHAIWSTLEDTRLRVPLADPRLPTLMSRYKVPHFDAKGESDRFFAEAGVPTTYLLTSFYWDNLIGFGMGPRPAADGRLVFTLPMGDRKLPGIAAEDIGRCALGIFGGDREFLGRRVGIAGGHLTGTEMAASLARALGREVIYQAIDPAVYRELGFPGAADLANMFQYNHDFADEFCASRDLAQSRALNPRLQSFDQWLAANKDRLPIEAMEGRQ